MGGILGIFSPTKQSISICIPFFCIPLSMVPNFCDKNFPNVPGNWNCTLWPLTLSVIWGYIDFHIIWWLWPPQPFIIMLLRNDWWSTCVDSQARLVKHFQWQLNNCCEKHSINVWPPPPCAVLVLGMCWVPGFNVVCMLVRPTIKVRGSHFQVQLV
jgi:hypothetical protein